MYTQKRDLVLRWLKVPPEPQPPFGDPASLRVFHAGRNFYKLKIFGWAVAEFFAFAGIIFWALVFIHVEETARIEKARRAAIAQVTAEARAAAQAQAKATLAQQAQQAVDGLKAAAESRSGSQLKEGTGTPATKAKQSTTRRRSRPGGWQGFLSVLVELAIIMPAWAIPLLWALKIIGLAGFLLQLPLTYAIRRLDYEMRWYVVTDRSLRIRTGVWSIQESTMSFANLQQVEVSQGPLQRLLGLADVKVQSAGGSEQAHGKPGDQLHTGYFHGVNNAQEIRDLILERLRRFRDSGLGDPEEARMAAAAAARPPETTPATAAPGDDDVLAAARELAAEAKALRSALG